MKSKVFGVSMRASFKENMLQKVDRILAALEISKGIAARDLVAIKLHFGEKGNTSFVRPLYVRRVVDAVAALGAQPFLTDANTLYVGSRTDAARHQRTAIENGFAFSVVGAPLVIADGLKGRDQVEVPLAGKHFQTAYIAAGLAEADALISVAHFKLHELSGFGGAMKNVGMGGASRRGKMAQHSDLCPKVSAKKCLGCGDCAAHCAQSAISLVEKDGRTRAVIDQVKCVGCAECIYVCPQKAMQIQFDQDVVKFQEKMVEYTLAALAGKEGKAYFVNFLTQITPVCDCAPFTDAAIVRDVGILASTDPVALDQASADLVNQQSGLDGSRLTTGFEPGQDKARAVYPNIDWSVQFAYAQELGLGVRDYELEWLPDKE
ncbi:MAG: DUF362 domain-containing protein [Thermodesulfobacteriota bacterium]